MVSKSAPERRRNDSVFFVLEWTANGRLFYGSIVYNMARQFRKTRRNAKSRRGTRKGGKRKIVKRQRGMRKKRGTRRRMVGGMRQEPTEGWEIGNKVKIKSDSHGPNSEGTIEGKRAVVACGYSLIRDNEQPNDTRITITANNPIIEDIVSNKPYVTFRVKDITSMKDENNEIMRGTAIPDYMITRYSKLRDGENYLNSMYVERFEYKINNKWTPGAQTYK